jgi:proline dehydrogenase
VPPLCALATHDEKMIAAAQRYIAEQNISLPAFEFQMLYGIRGGLARATRRRGLRRAGVRALSHALVSNTIIQFAYRC